MLIIMHFMQDTFNVVSIINKLCVTVILDYWRLINYIEHRYEQLIKLL